MILVSSYHQLNDNRVCVAFPGLGFRWSLCTERTREHACLDCAFLLQAAGLVPVLASRTGAGRACSTSDVVWPLWGNQMLKICFRAS